MKISYDTDLSNLNTKNGYGNAGFQIVQSLQALGHRVTFQDPDTDLSLMFVQPEYYGFTSPYNIGYTPWESTVVPQMWKYPITRCDEFWTTSEWCAQMFEDNGLKVDKVFHHGIDDIWKPVRRKTDGHVKFLHLGEPAPRKNGQQVLNVFFKYFANRPDVSLTIKAHLTSTLRIYDLYGNIVATPDMVPNIKLITDELSEEEMVALYWSHDALVYPSAGEGFGLIPLQALATGMPTVCTSNWAPYSHYLGDLGMNGRLIDSPWDFMHPGQVYEVSDIQIYERMQHIIDNFDSLSQHFYDQSQSVRKEFNWRHVTRNAFSGYEKVLETATL